MVETKILHYPRLDTVLLVENLIRARKEIRNKTALWDLLNRRVMFQTLTTILDYLEYSGKIYITKRGEILWVYNPERIKKMIKDNLVIR